MTFPFDAAGAAGPIPVRPHIPVRPDIPFGHRLAIAFAFLGAYALLNVGWPVLPPFPGAIPPWNPRPALGLVLILLLGPGWLPLALAAPVLSMAAGIGNDGSDGWPAVVLLVEQAIYGGAALLMRGSLRIDPDLRGFEDVLRFVGISAASAAVGALSFIFLATIAGHPVDGSVDPSVAGYWLKDPPILRYWLSDMIGVSVTGPFLLVLRRIPRSGGIRKRLFRWECAVQMLAVIVCLALIFPRTVGSRFYPLFIPLVWVAARFGLPGVAPLLMALEITFLGAMGLFGLQPNQVLKLQILMVTLTSTGLLLGAVVSERERARALVIQGEARLKAIIDMAPDGMLILDAGGRIDMANQRFERLCGHPSGDLLGRTLDGLVALPSSGGSGETVVTASDGSRTPVEASAAAIDIAGRRTTIVAVRDITERKLAWSRIDRRRAEVERLSRAALTGELAAVLAHELNQPLSAVVSYIGACQRLLAASEVPPRAIEQMDKASRQAARAADVVRRLREFVCNATLETAPVVVGDLIAEVMVLLADEAERIGAAITVETAPGLVVDVDRLQIEQVLINLLRNSLGAFDGLSPEGGTRSIRVQARRDDDAWVRVTVQDSGPGFPSELSAQLFTPFLTTRPSGMGLGLSISRSIVQAHGGQLWADEDEFPRAVMHFTLRAVSPAEDQPS